MIIFFTSVGHKYGPEALDDMTGAPDILVMSYNRLLRRKSLPMATYVFTDFDRLPFWQVELAAHVFRHLKKAGAKVLNDPARALQRMQMLKRLNQSGLNTFKVWDPTVDDLPDRYPVFLRTRSAHRSTITDLLPDRASAEAALTQALDDGYGIHDLMFVEYCAAPEDNGVFRKFAAFRIGDMIQMSMTVHERNWVAKYGEEGAGSAEQYEDEFNAVKSNPYNDVLNRAFDIANIDYGRADFAVINGAPQIYEINTNPDVVIFEEHPFPIRLESQAIISERFVAAMQTLDCPLDRGQKIALDHPSLVRQRKEDWLVLRERWIP